MFITHNVRLCQAKRSQLFFTETDFIGKRLFNNNILQIKSVLLCGVSVYRYYLQFTHFLRLITSRIVTVVKKYLQNYTLSYNLQTKRISMASNDGYIHSRNTISNFFIWADYLGCNPHLREKKFSVKDSSTTYRTINYWDSVGLLDDDTKDTEGKWRKFSKTDLAFIAIITRLRNAGFSIDKIKRTKQCLQGYLQYIVDGKNGKEWVKPKHPMNNLEFGYYCALAKQNEGNTYLIVEDDGTAEVLSELDLELNRDAGELPDSYYLINLNALFHKFFGDKFKVWDSNSHCISEDEAAVLESLRSDTESDTFTIQRKDTKITLIRKQCNKKPDGDLHNTINSIGYGSVEQKIVDGKVVAVKIIKQEKV